MRDSEILCQKASILFQYVQIASNSEPFIGIARRSSLLSFSQPHRDLSQTRAPWYFTVNRDTLLACVQHAILFLKRLRENLFNSGPETSY